MVNLRPPHCLSGGHITRGASQVVRPPSAPKFRRARSPFSSADPSNLLRRLLGLIRRQAVLRQPGVSWQQHREGLPCLSASQPRGCYYPQSRLLRSSVATTDTKDFTTEFSYTVLLPQKAPFVWVSVNNSCGRHTLLWCFGAMEFIMIIEPGNRWMWKQEHLKSPLNSKERKPVKLKAK